MNSAQGAQSGQIPRVAFLIVGCMKCGTTSIARTLSSHESIFMNPREVHFFDHQQRYLSVWEEGRLDPKNLQSEYGRHFRTTKALAGSKAPSYITSAACLERVQRFHPLAKLIVMLRDPVERARSHWTHLLRARAAGNIARDALEPNLYKHLLRDQEELQSPRLPDGEISHYNILHRGCYAEQLRCVYRLFPRERVFTGFLCDLRDAPVEFYRKLLGFLEVPVDQKALSIVTAAQSPVPRYRLTADERSFLCDFYGERTGELEQLTGRHLSAWCRRDG